MKVIRRLSDTTTVEAEGDTVAEVHEAIARLEAIFCYESCGLCGGIGVRHECQEDKEGNKYHKVICLGCGAEFRFGLRRGDEGVLFPSLTYGGGPKKDHPREGQVKPNGGWAKWVPQGQQEDPVPAKAPTREEVLWGKAMAILEPAAKRGSAALKNMWESLSPEMKQVSRGDISRLVEEARAVAS